LVVSATGSGGSERQGIRRSPGGPPAVSRRLVQASQGCEDSVNHAVAPPAATLRATVQPCRQTHAERSWLHKLARCLLQLPDMRLHALPPHSPRIRSWKISSHEQINWCPLLAVADLHTRAQAEAEQLGVHWSPWRPQTPLPGDPADHRPMGSPAGDPFFRRPFAPEPQALDP
jgi:hypothetical protein